jgi:hypothetical protein
MKDVNLVVIIQQTNIYEMFLARNLCVHEFPIHSMLKQQFYKSKKNVLILASSFSILFIGIEIKLIYMAIAFFC